MEFCALIFYRKMIKSHNFLHILDATKKNPMNLNGEKKIRKKDNTFLVKNECTRVHQILRRLG